MKILVLFLLLYSSALFAQVERERVEAAFIVKFTAFIKSSMPIQQSYNICTWAENKIFLRLSLDLEHNSFEGIPFAVFEADKNTKKIECHVLITGSETSTIDWKSFENSIHITKNKNYFEKAVIFLKQNGGGIRFDINYRWAQQHGLKISPKLLQIADYIEK